MVIKINGDLTRLKGSVKPDDRRRVVLPADLVQKDIIYHVWYNDIGQIILDPQVTIPASEAWLFNNPDALALVQRGLSDVREGRVSKIDLKTL